MRVCLFSKYGQSANFLYEGTHQGLKENGIEYLDINVSLERGEQTPYWPSIPTLRPQKPTPKDEKILKKIKQFEPDLILLLQYSGLSFLVDNGENLREALGAKGKVALWLVDLTEKIYENKTLGKLLNRLFLTNGAQLKEYKKRWAIRNAYFLPQGCFVTKVFPAKVKKVYPLGFLGRRQREDPRYGPRNLLLNRFKKEFELIESEGKLNLKETQDFYQKCQIVVGSSWQNDVYLYSSDRIFNVLGAGSFYLCSYFPGIEKLFENHKHLVWFTNVEEGLDLASFYLKNGEKREKIAYNGYRLVCQKHTYKKRVENIVKIVQNKINFFEGFL